MQVRNYWDWKRVWRTLRIQHEICRAHMHVRQHPYQVRRARQHNSRMRESIQASLMNQSYASCMSRILVEEILLVLQQRTRIRAEQRRCCKSK